jgi:hypothetical protein
VARFWLDVRDLDCFEAETNRFILSSEHYVPDPNTATVWGLPPPLSLIEILAVRWPVVVGVNVTVMKQLALAATATTREIDVDRQIGERPRICKKQILHTPNSLR